MCDTLKRYTKPSREGTRSLNDIYNNLVPSNEHKQKILPIIFIIYVVMQALYVWESGDCYRLMSSPLYLLLCQGEREKKEVNFVLCSAIEVCSSPPIDNDYEIYDVMKLTNSSVCECAPDSLGALSSCVSRLPRWCVKLTLIDSWKLHSLINSCTTDSCFRFMSSTKLL